MDNDNSEELKSFLKYIQSENCDPEILDYLGLAFLYYLSQFPKGEGIRTPKFFKDPILKSLIDMNFIELITFTDWLLVWITDQGYQVIENLKSTEIFNTFNIGELDTEMFNFFDDQKDF